MKEKTCCFTGHRQIPKKHQIFIERKLYSIISELIENGYCYFGVGGALGFDTIAAKIILKLKKIYPQIKLILVFPCKNQTKNWLKKDIEIYEKIKSLCDKYVYVSEEYTKDCMLRRNRHLIDNSSYCICYLTKNTGGTAYTVKYATQKGVTIYNIAKELPKN